VCSGCPAVQLHVHSRFSFKDGLAPVDDLVGRAAELGMPGMGLTDHGVLYGAPALFRSCKAHGIRGVIGMEAYEAVPHAFDMERDGEVFDVKWADLGDRDRYYHLTLWVMNETGWRNLVALHTQSYTAGFHPNKRGKPLLDRASMERHHEGLMVGLGCMASRTNVTLARESYDLKAAYEQAKWYKEVFEDRAYMELMGNTADQQALLRPERQLAAKLGMQTVAVNDVHYRDRVDGVENGAHHTLVKSRAFKKADTEASTDKSDDGFGSWYGSDGFYMKSGPEMVETGFQVDEVARTVEVLDRVTFDFDALSKPKPPIPVLPEPGDDPGFDAYLAQAVT
jgi:DNA polymerase-3 subunit alpha